MTGAPKRRTMEILDRLEAAPRGIYAGALGYLSASGVVDLSVVIRTAVVRGGEVTVGVGGAVVALSDPAAELDEILVKGRAPMRAITLSVGDVPAESTGAAAALQDDLRRAASRSGDDRAGGERVSVGAHDA